ncbi:MAG TPA: glycosyltransferase family 4 protein [Candidatus Limnocylindria bacterium]|nr:glycosyltransferase family 4 protein [Candidatus Limnocylindria bacterium]
MSRKKQRILFLHYTAPSILGGVEHVMGTHAEAAQRAGDDVAIVAGRGSARSVPVVLIPELDTQHPAVLRDRAALANGEVRPEHAILVGAIARKLRPHIRHADRVVVHNAFTLHLNAALTEALVGLAAERPGVFIAWTHDLAWTDAQYLAQRHEGRPWSLFASAADGVRYVAISEKAASELAALTGLARSAITIVPNGVDRVAVLGLSRTGVRIATRLGLFEADPLLVLPVRMTRRKRIEIAIDALAELRKSHPNAALVVTGGPGAHNPLNVTYERELAARAGPGVHLLHAERIRIGARELADLYGLADALVLPSANEGFGLPMLEAGLRRLPIICTDIPALREVGREDATYLPLDADGAAFARAIEARLAGDPVARLHRRARENEWPRILADRVLPVIHG